MSFETEKEKASSNKIILAEIDIGRFQQEWLNYCAGIWYYRFNTFIKNQEHSFGYGNFCFGSFGSSGIFDSGIKFIPFDIKSCFVDGEEYSEVSSIVNMIATNKSWYYGRDETEFYIHIDKFEDPRQHKVIVGLTLGLSNKSKHINNGYYEPRIKGHPVISKTKDPLEFGIIRFDGGSLTLDNEDGFFDHFADSILFGQPARVLYGIDGLDGTEMAYADYKKICKSYIETINTKWLECQLGLVDYRKLLSRKIPINVFNKTDHPNLADKNIGKSIPLPWGSCNNVPCICINEVEDPAPSEYTFKAADILDHPDGIREISKAYVADIETDIQSKDLLEGTFNLSSADYSPGQKVTADIIGFGTKNLVNHGDCENVTPPMFLGEKDDPPQIANATWARDSAQKRTGSYSYKLTKTVAAGSVGHANLVNNINMDHNMVPGIEPNVDHNFSGMTVTFSVYVYIPSSGGPLPSEFILQIWDYYNSWVNTDSVTPTLTDTWERITVTRTIRSGATGIIFRMQIQSGAGSGEYVYIDDIQVEINSSPTDFIILELWDNSLNILEDILSTYLAIPYNSEYFNQTEWDEAKSNAFDIGPFLEKPEKITEIIEKTALSNFGNFIILDDGRYTFRILDRTASASKTVLLNEYFDEPEIDFDGNKFISKIRIGYAEDYGNDEYRWYQDDSLEDEIVAEYKKHSDREYETYLTNETDAKALAEKFMDLMKKVRGTIKTRTGIQNIEFEVSDIVNLTLDRRDRTWKGPLKTEIIGLKKDLLGTGKVSIEGLVIED